MWRRLQRKGAEDVSVSRRAVVNVGYGTGSWQRRRCEEGWLTRVRAHDEPDRVAEGRWFSAARRRGLVYPESGLHRLGVFR